jgi:branched-chain amino acid transport system ATP-binding protein
LEESLPLLSVRGLTISFGGVRAVDDLAFELFPGSIFALIGPNGAGKTTVLNSISGLVRAHGSIHFAGRELLNQPPHRRTALGIGRTFQSVQLFGELTLLDNMLIGQHATLGGNVFADLAGLPAIGRERTARTRAMDLLRRFQLERYASRTASSLPFGIQKLAGVARALAARPRLLLLDEPAAGLNRAEAEDLAGLVRTVRTEFGQSILLVEHNMRLVMGISDRVLVLDRGIKLAEGSPHDISADPAVIEAYLGEVRDAESNEEVPDEPAQRS